MALAGDRSSLDIPKQMYYIARLRFFPAGHDSMGPHLTSLCRGSMILAQLIPLSSVYFDLGRLLRR